MFASRGLLSRCRPVPVPHTPSPITRVYRPFSTNAFTPRTTFNLPNGISLHIAQGDLTLFTGDAIINAANERMLGGGGVDGAIHRGAGKELVQWIKDNVATVSGNEHVRCRTGDAVITPGFALNASHIIHTVGPIYDHHKHPEKLLRSSYNNCLSVAQENSLQSIAFPAISCGVFGYPKFQAMRIAFVCVQQIEEKGSLQDVWFILYGDEMYQIGVSVAESLFGEATQ